MKAFADHGEVEGDRGHRAGRRRQGTVRPAARLAWIDAKTYSRYWTGRRGEVHRQLHNSPLASSASPVTRSPSTSPWSANAFMVASGMVLTVLATTSSVT